MSDMAEVALEPDMAAKCIAMLNEKLRGLRSDLGQKEQENAELREQVAHLDGRQSYSRAHTTQNEVIKGLRHELGLERETVRRLETENASIKALLGSYEGSGEAGRAGCAGRGCQAGPQLPVLPEALKEAETQLDQMLTAYTDAQERVAELLEQRTQSQATEVAQGHQIERLKQKLAAEREYCSALENRMVELKQQSNQNNKDACEHRLNVDDMPTMPSTEWRAVMENVLSSPYLPPDDMRAPFHLVPQVKQHIRTDILSCPNRIIFPYSNGYARLITPVARCEGSTAPDKIGAPMIEFARHTGKLREVFYHTNQGICYAGTFLCGPIGDVSREEYAAFPKRVKEAILRHTFPNKAEFTATSNDDLERVRSMYLDGRFRTQYLVLRYVGRNQPLADALAAFSSQKKARTADEGTPPPCRPGRSRLHCARDQSLDDNTPDCSESSSQHRGRSPAPEQSRSVRRSRTRPTPEYSSDEDTRTPPGAAVCTTTPQCQATMSRAAADTDKDIDCANLLSDAGTQDVGLPPRPSVSLHAPSHGSEERRTSHRARSPPRAPRAAVLPEELRAMPMAGYRISAKRAAPPGPQDDTWRNGVKKARTSTGGY